MTGARVSRRLDRLLRDSPLLHGTPKDRWVILSDLHIGDGSPRDEFRHNKDLVHRALEAHYLPRRFRLILNGDIEDLYKVPLRAITTANRDTFDLFAQFQRDAGLYKITGNHDLDLTLHNPALLRFPLLPGLRLRFGEQETFILHGHQADFLTHGCHRLVSLFMRHVATPLRIPNGGVAHDSGKRYRTEKLIYDFAKSRGLLAIIGHTHRPLFESLSRIDYLKFEIEKLCRAYPRADAAEREALGRKARLYQTELQQALDKGPSNGARAGLYDSGRLLPCVFNSGCATGKRGVTAIEIADGQISLVFWFDPDRTTKYFNFNGYRPEALLGTPYYRVPLKTDSLDYIHARIRLLAWGQPAGADAAGPIEELSNTA